MTRVTPIASVHDMYQYQYAFNIVLHSSSCSFSSLSSLFDSYSSLSPSLCSYCSLGCSNLSMDDWSLWSSPSFKSFADAEENVVAPHALSTLPLSSLSGSSSQNSTG